MFLIMETKISIIYIQKYKKQVSWELLVHARLQFAFPTDRFCFLCIESPWLDGALGDRERLAGLGLMDGFLGTGGLHLGSLKKKKSHTHLFVFNTNERFRQMDLLLAFFFFFVFFFFLSFARYILFPLKCSKVNIYALRVWIPLCLSQKDISTRLNSTNVRTVN